MTKKSSHKIHIKFHESQRKRKVRDPIKSNESILCKKRSSSIVQSKHNLRSLQIIIDFQLLHALLYYRVKSRANFNGFYALLSLKLGMNVAWHDKTSFRN